MNNQVESFSPSADHAQVLSDFVFREEWLGESLPPALRQGFIGGMCYYIGAKLAQKKGAFTLGFAGFVR